MKLPFTFSQYLKSPFAAISLLCIMGMGYLYVDMRNTHDDIIESYQKSEQIKNERITKLEKDVSELQNKIIELATMYNKRD